MEKDPQAKLDYAVDWTAWLGSSETISTSTWTVPSGLTKSAESNTTALAVVWLTGGTVGERYALTNHIITNQGREDDRTFTVLITQK